MAHTNARKGGGAALPTLNSYETRWKRKWLCNNQIIITGHEYTTQISNSNVNFNIPDNIYKYKCKAWCVDSKLQDFSSLGGIIMAWQIGVIDFERQWRSTRIARITSSDSWMKGSIMKGCAEWCGRACWGTRRAPLSGTIATLRGLPELNARGRSGDLLIKMFY